MVTIGDSAFPRHSWLLKSYKEDTRDPQQKYFNKKLCSARAVTENAYGMLTGSWRILHKQTECRMYNLKYVVISCIMLYNLSNLSGVFLLRKIIATKNIYKFQASVTKRCAFLSKSSGIFW